MPMIIKMILWALLAYTLWCTLLFLMQRQILFPRGLISGLADSKPNIPALEKIWLETASGKTEAWYLAPDRASREDRIPAVIFGHGNGELIDFWPEELVRFTQMGLALMLVEYPGYGRSAGSPSEQSITDAFLAAYDNLIHKPEVDPSRVILFGRSLGGGAVCALARRRQSAALILMSTFTSVRAFTARYLAPGFLVRDPFDNLSTVQSYKNPILIIHGRHDEVIPFSHGKRLYQTAQKGTLAVYDAGHNDCPPDWSRFWRDVEEFLTDTRIIKSHESRPP
jgi:fermentation-respiration switch protein FrsA (DUF1100 family)